MKDWPSPAWTTDRDGLPEPIDDLMGPGVVGIEYDGAAYRFSIDGNVWGLSHWAIVDTTGDIAAWDGDDD